MQRLKLFTVSYRFLTKQYLVKNTCVSKYLDHYGDSRNYNSSSKFSAASPFLLKTGNPSPFLNVVCHRHKSTPVKDEKEEKQSPKDDRSTESEEPAENLTLFKRYKKMLKEYWYVLLPVHLVTSAFWFGSFYYAATRGLDIVPFLEYINLPEYLIEPLRKSSLGHIAVASAIYKLATPARYMVTVGMTTFAVKFLTKRGLIRPVPTKAQIKTIIQNKMKKDTDK